MTIASELTALQTNLENAYDAVEAKGGTLPAAQNFDNLDTAIGSIPSGGGMDTVEAYNDTGSSIITGDKVWINKGDVYGRNFDIVGSPVIDYSNSIVSGFSTSDYLKLQNLFNPGNNSWEVRAKVTTGASVSTEQDIFGATEDQMLFRIGLAGTTTNRFQILVSNGTTWINSSTHSGSYVVQPETIYWIKAGFDGTNTYYLDYSLDGINYTRDVTYTSSSKIGAVSGVYNTISTPSSSVWTGNIDLSETKIIINNTDWWIPNFTKLADYKLVDFLEQNTPNVTKMGSVTFTDDYIGSGFSSSNYIKSNTTISEIGTADSWEFVTKIYMTSTMSTNGMIINQNTGSYGESGFMIIVGGSNYIYFQVFDQSLNLIFNIVSSVSLENNQWYWLKGEFTGTAYNCYISTDKETWTNVGTAASTTKVHTPTSPWRFGSSVVNSSFYLHGKMDFKETYLKINGEVAWNAIGYSMSGNITEDTLTGTAAENIAIGGTGDVNTLLIPNT